MSTLTTNPQTRGAPNEEKLKLINNSKENICSSKNNFTEKEENNSNLKTRATSQEKELLSEVSTACETNVTKRNLVLLENGGGKLNQGCLPGADYQDCLRDFKKNIFFFIFFKNFDF